jgi:phosphate transport system permease protein
VTSDPARGSGSPSFTGRRGRTSRRSVRAAERIARALITVGGVGTISAVALILVFLVSVVVPLFQGADLTFASESASSETDARTLRIGIDEYRVLEWRLGEDGVLSVRRVDDGGLVERRELFPSGSLTAFSPVGDGDSLALGFSDGTLRIARIGFRADILDSAAREALHGAVEGDRATVDGTTLVRRTAQGEMRRHAVAVDLGPPIQVGEAAVRLIDVSGSDDDRVAALDGDGNLALLAFERRENLLTGEVQTDAETFVLPAPAERSPPQHLLLSGGGDMLYLAWRDGRMVRYDLRDPRAASIVEEIDLVPSGAELSALGFVIGKTTLISGDSRGRVRGWFNVKPPDAPTRDGARLTLAHELFEGGPAVTALAPSARSRVAAAGFADGSLRLWHVTSHKLLGESFDARGAPIEALAIAPKEDGIFALSSRGARHWDMDLGHPEVSAAALFRPVFLY